MKRQLILLGTLPLFLTMGLPANAAIHEMVSAFCSGGGVGTIEDNGFLEPPGVTNPDNLNSFRRPANASGVVVGGVIGSSPAAKYPEGMSVRNELNPGGPALSNHPSAEHCKNMQAIP